jgi:tagaturonate epimerase
MESLARLITNACLTGLSQDKLEEVTRKDPTTLCSGQTRIYPRSLHVRDSILHLIATTGGKKNLYLAAEKSFTSAFHGLYAHVGGLFILKADYTWDNAKRLHEVFPFSAPSSLRDRKTTIGCGDRLGLATPGHIAAVARFQASAVFAQQSLRELTSTGRDFPKVVSDVTFHVFQEGFTSGYGADGDHLRSIKDIDAALDAKMTMITLDLTEAMSFEPAFWSAGRVNEEFEKIDRGVVRHVLEKYAGRIFAPAGCQIIFDTLEAKRCALMYWRALEFSRKVDDHLKRKRGNNYDLEISIDETVSPTPLSHHLFIAQELARRGVVVSSMAPRFIGDFQKGIDYIGDPVEFESQFKAHCAIAKEYGDYKISIHSGSDKFSVYPAIGTHTNMRLHLKTSGTTWLEALRIIARANPALFRTMLAKSLDHFTAASKLYHVTTNLDAIPNSDHVPDSELEKYLNANDSRQVLHITYGGLLCDARIKSEILSTLIENEQKHYQAVEENLINHIKKLGVPLAL